MNDPIPNILLSTDIANAQRLAIRHGENIRYTSERGWLIWDGKRWKQDDTDKIAW